MADQNRKPHPRPLSPHLQVYRPQLTSVLSIFHRITGAALCLMLPFWAYFLHMMSQGKAHFETLMMMCNHPLMQLIFFLALTGFVYHFYNGIRHLIWDRARGLEISEVYRSGWIVLGATLLTVFFLIGLFWAGGPLS